MPASSAIVWLVAGSDAAAQECQRLLEQSGQLDVRRVPLRASVEEHADLAANPDTGAIVIADTIARQVRGAYNSTVIADYLRALRVELPIFILCSDAAACEEPLAADGTFTVAELRRRPEVYAGRILRALGRYHAALSGRQQRLQELIDRQLAGSLSPAEAEELAELRADVERPSEVRLAKQAEQHAVDLADRRHLVEQLEALAEKLNRRNRDKS